MQPVHMPRLNRKPGLWPELVDLPLEARPLLRGVFSLDWAACSSLWVVPEEAPGHSRSFAAISILDTEEEAFCAKTIGTQTDIAYRVSDAVIHPEK